MRAISIQKFIFWSLGSLRCENHLECRVIPCWKFTVAVWSRLPLCGTVLRMSRQSIRDNLAACRFIDSFGMTNYSLETCCHRTFVATDNDYTSIRHISHLQIYYVQLLSVNRDFGYTVVSLHLRSRGNRSTHSLNTVLYQYRSDEAKTIAWLNPLIGRIHSWLKNPR